MIQNNSDLLIEGMIDDLLIDCVFDLQDIEEAQKENYKKNNLLWYLSEAYEKVNMISQNEQDILRNYNIKLGKK